MEQLVTLTNYDVTGDDNHRVTEWELGLPSVNDLTPLSQSLVPLDLATAFKITPEPHRTMSDVTRASHNTLSVIQQLSVTQPLNKPLLNSNGLFNGFISDGNEMNIETEENVAIVDVTKDGLDTDDSCARTSKRPRLVWTPQLHKRFVEVVAHLGVKNAVPKTIMQLMNVEGLTRENVASHLQKYRLYLKRMQGLSNEGVSSSDCLFDSTPVPQSVQESSGGGNGNGNGNGCSVSVPIPYPTQMVHMSNYHGFESHPFNVMVQQRDWSGNKFGSVSGYQQRMSNDK